MLLVDSTNDGSSLNDLADFEVREMYVDARAEYEIAVFNGDNVYWQQACASAVRMLSDEAKRRGLFLRTLH